MSGGLTRLVPVLVLIGLFAVVNRAAKPPRRIEPPATVPADVRPAVLRLDEALEAEWARRGLKAAGPADDLTVLRRLSLGLHGALPSIEELQRFRQDGPGRLERFTERMLADRRFEEYFAERLARAVVGTEGGQFLIYRRDRLVGWLAEQLRADTPWHEIVSRLVSEQGLWTGKPATNFITAAVADEKIDPMKLAGRSVRAFLGQRIDCAQCHDHPFAPWKQSQFEGIAAFYGAVDRSIIGIEDGKGHLEVEDRKTLKKRLVPARAPYAPELMPAQGTLRQRFAAWVTHRDNRRFSRALANRVWGLAFGKPLVAPVDDVPDPPAKPDLLDVLAEDAVKHGHSIKRLVRVITRSRAFRASSTHAETEPRKLAKLEESFAVFPLVRLRPEQVIGAMMQAASIRTVDRNANLLQRFIRFVRESDFVKGYGDFGDTELDERGGTIPQRLLMLNGKLVRELADAHPFSLTGRIHTLVPTDAGCLEFLFLACLTRLPEPDERRALLPVLAEKKGDARARAVEDLFWTLVNSTEFSWNH